MDVKTALLNDFMNKEVYTLNNLLGLRAYNFQNHVLKLKKALYAMKKAPRVTYECMTD